MPKRSPRPFTLADMMILVAATAGWLTLPRWLSARIGQNSMSFMPWNWIAALWMRSPGCFVAVWTLALVALRWRRPRPSAARILRQPGAVACLAAVGSMISGFALEVALTSLDRHEKIGQATLYDNSVYWFSALNMAPFAVMGAWMALALGGRWSPERSWVDRMGIALGIFWLAWYPVSQLGMILLELVPYPR